MQIHHLSENNSVLNHFLAEIRNVNIQNDSLRFRRNIERIGEIMAYELSKNLDYKATSIPTPLGSKNTFLVENKLEKPKCIEENGLGRVGFRHCVWLVCSQFVVSICG